MKNNKSPMMYKSEKIEPTYGLNAFIDSLDIPLSYHGLASLIYKNFAFIVKDTEYCLRAAVDINASAYIELRHDISSNGITWNCRYIKNDDSLLLWSVCRRNGERYFDEPIKEYNNISLLVNKNAVA